MNIAYMFVAFTANTGSSLCQRQSVCCVRSFKDHNHYNVRWNWHWWKITKQSDKCLTHIKHIESYFVTNQQDHHRHHASHPTRWWLYFLSRICISAPVIDMLKTTCQRYSGEMTIIFYTRHWMTSKGTCDWSVRMVFVQYNIIMNLYVLLMDVEHRPHVMNDWLHDCARNKPYNNKGFNHSYS